MPQMTVPGPCHKCVCQVPRQTVPGTYGTHLPTGLPQQKRLHALDWLSWKAELVSFPVLQANLKPKDTAIAFH